MAQNNPNAVIDTAIHEIVSRRWSPREFDGRPVEPESIRSLFEAARWAASSRNAQPWFFIVGTRDDPETYGKLLDSFVERNQAWAKSAPVLALSVARSTFENGERNRHAWHDVGQAAASLALQASALGLQIRQMGGILSEKARDAFEIPEGFDPVAGFAIGYPKEVNASAQAAPRTRKPLEAFVFAGKWGKAAPVVGNNL